MRIIFPKFLKKPRSCKFSKFNTELVIDNRYTSVVIFIELVLKKILSWCILCFVATHDGASWASARSCSAVTGVIVFVDAIAP